MARKKDLQSLFEEIGDAYKELKLLFMEAEDMLEMSEIDFYGDRAYSDELTNFVKGQSRFTGHMASKMIALEYYVENGTLDSRIHKSNKEISQIAKRSFK